MRSSRCWSTTSSSTARSRPTGDGGGFLRLLDAIGSIIENVSVTRELDGGTFFAATVEEHPVDGVLVERKATEGRIAEITLMLRPLAQLQAAVARMARVLSERA